jgi:hypothetical protein
LEDRAVDGRMALKWILGRYRDQWQALVNAVMNLRVLEPQS